MYAPPWIFVAASARVVAIMLFCAAAQGCNDAGFAVVSINPIFDWVEGCNDATVSGHGFSTRATASIGANPLEDISWPDGETEKLDVGFEIHGRIPAGEQGYADLAVENEDGERSVVDAAFYYVACLGTPWVDGALPFEGITPGTTITVAGCSLDAATMHARLVPQGKKKGASSDALPLEVACRSARVTFTAPKMPEGAYMLTIEDEKDARQWPVEPCKGETGDTGGCQEPVVLTYGGER
jgi:hypothetical protein